MFRDFKIAIAFDKIENFTNLRFIKFSGDDYPPFKASTFRIEFI